MELVIDKLNVTVDDKNILKDFSLTIKSGEIHAIMGPNGVGKSTLSKVIMGNKDYHVISGDIKVNNESILTKETDEIARLGIFLVYQNPVSIPGITNSEFIRTALNERSTKRVNIYDFIKELDYEIDSLKMDHNMSNRSLNEGFSGGETKKNEILQMKILKPEFIILDELDSGLDVDSLRVVCENIKDYLNNYKDTSVLLITHYTRILEYIKPSYVHMMKDGAISLSGDYNLALNIEKNGYNKSFDLGDNDDFE